MKYSVPLMSIITLIVAGYFGRLHARELLSDTTSIFDTFEETKSGWLFSDKIGSANASPIERARVALGGPLGLSSKEVIYFVAVKDSGGRRLTSSCTYRVSGSAFDTRWWSLTLYDSQTQNYVENVDRRSSWNSAQIPTNADGGWEMNVASTPQAAAWLPAQSTEDQPFELNLRLYNPSPSLREKLPDIDVPTVERTSC